MNLEIESFAGELKTLREHHKECSLTKAPEPVIHPIKRFDNRTTSTLIGQAINIAERLLAANSSMMLEISAKNDFKYDSGAGKEVAAALLVKTDLVKVFYYRPWNPWTAAIGYSDGEAIYINSRRQLELNDIIANLCHEYAHHQGFHHGDNYYTKDKGLFSVPYFISDNIGRWV